METIRQKRGKKKLVLRKSFDYPTHTFLFDAILGY